MKPHYRLEVRVREGGYMSRGVRVFYKYREWRVRDADGWYTEWQMSAREACAKMRYGLVL